MKIISQYKTKLLKRKSKMLVKRLYLQHIGATDTLHYDGNELDIALISCFS